MSLLATLLGEPRTLENPAVSLSDAKALDELFGGGLKTSSGISVTRDKALAVAAVWQAVNLISCDVAKLPLFIYRRESSGKVRATEHPAYALLRHKPNANETAFVFRTTATAHALLQGNGFAWIERNPGDGAPVALIHLNPDTTWPVLENGRLWIVKQLDGGAMVKMYPADVHHLRGLGYDGLVGYSVIKYAADSLGTGIAAREYGSRFFRNDARPGMVLEHPATLSDVAAKHLKESWEHMHAGLSNAHKVAILEEGMKVHTVTIAARDAQLIEQRQFEIREIASWFGLPPHKLGDPSRTAYNSLEQENQSYLDTALDRWLVAWEEECRDKLLTEDEKAADSHVVEFQRAALLRADLTQRANYFKTATGNQPWMTPNEVRGVENMNLVGDDQADKLHYPTSTSTTPDKPAADAGAVRAAVLPLITDTARRMARRIAAGARKCKDPVDYANRIAAEHRDVLLDAMLPVAQGLQRAGAEALIADAALAQAGRLLAAGGADECEAKLPAVIIAAAFGDQP